MKRQCLDLTSIDAQRQALQDALERLDREAAERATSQTGSPALNRVAGVLPNPVNTSTPIQAQSPAAPADNVIRAPRISNPVQTPTQTPPNTTAVGQTANPTQALTTQYPTGTAFGPTINPIQYQPYHRGRGRGRERGADSRGRLFMVMTCVAHDVIFCQQCIRYVSSNTYWSRHPELPDPE